MSDLQRRFPWHHEFLTWHNERLKIYGGAPARVELWRRAREWVSKDIRSELRECQTADMELQALGEEHD